MTYSFPLLAVDLKGLFILPGKSASICFTPHEPDADRGAWSFAAGVAFITSNNINEIIGGDINVDNGPAGGEIYSLTATRRLGQFNLELWGHTFQPQLELPLTLEIIDENSRSPFFGLNASLVVRWEEFPWSHLVHTTFATGVGLSYDDQVYLMDISRHPGSDRSHLKFNWPLQLTFAHPEHPDHQLMLFIAHQSGGRIFDDGGVNSLGIGYRFSY
ncbi:hypothetical protein [Haloferula sp.]|uniref:hypothetical protein n=1 Tax=Haloferula sp. TaxID=2497595 RepID=UPI003C70B8DF